MYYAGIDAGSLSTKAVVLRGEELAGFTVIPTGAGGAGVARRALEEVLDRAGLAEERLECIVATGYGRISVPFAKKKVTEIACHGRGAHFLFPGTRTVIDIGGQDSKVIRLNEAGKVVDFVMNDKCAAGTGRFLEVMARALEVELHELGRLSGAARKAAPVSSMCTVFAESEVVSLVAEGRPREEIILGLHESVAERVANMAWRLDVEPEVTMTGGVAKNAGVVQCIEVRLGLRMNIPPEPQIVGALGAALLARELAI